MKYIWKPSDGGSIWIDGRHLRVGDTIELDGPVDRLGPVAVAGLAPLVAIDSEIIPLRITVKSEPVKPVVAHTVAPRKRGRPAKAR